MGDGILAPGVEIVLNATVSKDERQNTKSAKPILFAWR
jgi:hypothetical protein